MVDHHQEAWEYVSSEILGTEIIEVTTKIPWGFKEDLPSIRTMLVGDFLSSPYLQADTIILHILHGEGLDRKKVEYCIVKALNNCVKLIILEHNPGQWDSVEDISYIRQQVSGFSEKCWGRNLMLFGLTTYYLKIPSLSNNYLDKHLNYTFVHDYDEGIDKNLLIYTHTSESRIDFSIPYGPIYWVIGGGLAYESMPIKNINILFDSVLRQVLLAALVFEKDSWKIFRIWPELRNIKYDSNYKQWRRVFNIGKYPYKIMHKDIKDLDIEETTVYTSTIEKKYWEHLSRKNNIIESVTERDRPRLVLKNEV